MNAVLMKTLIIMKWKQDNKWFNKTNQIYTVEM